MSELISRLRDVRTGYINATNQQNVQAVFNEFTDIIEQTKALQQQVADLQAKNEKQQISVDYWSEMFSHSLYGTMGELKAAAIRELFSNKKEEVSINGDYYFIVEAEVAEAYADSLRNNGDSE